MNGEKVCHIDILFDAQITDNVRKNLAFPVFRAWNDKMA
jgi:hypothetical protein